MGRTPLADDRIKAGLADLKGWSYSDNALSKTFEFGSFREAVGFFVRVSFEAEQLNHHPEVENVYNRVKLTLRTHDAGGKVTEADFALARAIESFSWL